MNSFERIKAAAEICEWVTEDKSEKTRHWLINSRVISTGECKVHDYGTGFLLLRVELYNNFKYKKGYQVAISITTSDDGGLYGSITVSDKESATYLFEKAMSVFEELNYLPDEDELNEELKHFGIQLIN